MYFPPRSCRGSTAVVRARRERARQTCCRGWQPANHQGTLTKTCIPPPPSEFYIPELETGLSKCFKDPNSDYIRVRSDLGSEFGPRVVLSKWRCPSDPPERHFRVRGWVCAFGTRIQDSIPQGFLYRFRLGSSLHRCRRVGKKHDPKAPNITDHLSISFNSVLESPRPTRYDRALYGMPARSARPHINLLLLRQARTAPRPC